MTWNLPPIGKLRSIHSHPTFSEAVLEVAQALHGQAIHQPPVPANTRFQQQFASATNALNATSK